jgi:serine/threonine protein kinase
VIPGYEVGGEIARGGMGAVLAARELALDREVAIKVLLPGVAAHLAVRRFVVESRITARLPHPNIPPVYALGELADGSPFLAMKLIRGRTLAELLADRPDPSADLPRFVGVVEQVCQAVAFAHSQGIIHRDLKPSNVMVGAFGEVQVMDWGIAKDLPPAAPGPPDAGPAAGGVPAEVADRSRPAAPDGTTALAPPGRTDDPGGAQETWAGAVLGTPAYMAPEQARGEPADARSDVFALGGVLCAVLTGGPPFPGGDAGTALRRAAAGDLADALARLDACGADAELVALARRCLSHDPAGRPTRPRSGRQWRSTGPGSSGGCGRPSGSGRRPRRGWPSSASGGRSSSP